MGDEGEGQPTGEKGGKGPRYQERMQQLETQNQQLLAQMQEMMRSMGQMDMPEIKPILEINPNHDIVSKLKDKTRQKSFDNIAYLLYEQALIQEGVKLEDPSGFVNRLNNVIKETL